MPDIYLYPALTNPNDIGLLDPTIVILDGVAALSSAAGLTAAGELVMEAGATPSSTASLTAAGLVVVDGQAALASSASITAAGDALVDGGASLASVASIAATGSAAVPTTPQSGTSPKQGFVGQRRYVSRSSYRSAHSEVYGKALLSVSVKIKAAGSLSFVPFRMRAKGSVVMDGRARLDSRLTLSAAGDFAWTDEEELLELALLALEDES
jgi:hypothetical protein